MFDAILLRAYRGGMCVCVRWPSFIGISGGFRIFIAQFVWFESSSLGLVDGGDVTHSTFDETMTNLINRFSRLIWSNTENPCRIPICISRQLSNRCNDIQRNTSSNDVIVNISSWYASSGCQWDVRVFWLPELKENIYPTRCRVESSRVDVKPALSDDIHHQQITNSI